VRTRSGNGRKRERERERERGERGRGSLPDANAEFRDIRVIPRSMYLHTTVRFFETEAVEKVGASAVTSQLNVPERP
jgi:hypothetical protein